MKKMHIAVIGRGLIGSAAARHLSVAGRKVTLIGPDEPKGKATHQGVFASHYDEGRITRAMDPDPFWARVSQASIERYAEIQAASGIPFFNEVGAMIAGPPYQGPMQRVQKQYQAMPHLAEILNFDTLSARFPYFHFPDDTIASYEMRGAGHISPRNLVRAQNVIAEKQGVVLVKHQVSGICETQSGVQIETPEGQIVADQAVIAAGGYSNTLLANALPLSVYARTVAYFEVASLRPTMPSLIQWSSEDWYTYLLPPIRYPDGRIYLKLGGDPEDIKLESGAEMRDWFRSGGSSKVGDFLTDHMRVSMPKLEIASISTAACVTTFTPHDRPIIDRISDRITVATAGCGRGAKCSDELGRMACAAVMGQIDPECGFYRSVPSPSLQKANL